MVKDKPVVIIVPEHKHIVTLPASWATQQNRVSYFMQMYERFMEDDKKKVMFAIGDITIQLMKGDE